MQIRSWSWPASALVLVGWVLSSPGAPEAAPAVGASPDIHFEIGSLSVADEDVFEDSGGAPGFVSLGPIPENADVVGFEDLGDSFLFSLDTTVLLNGGALIAEPRDVVAWNGMIHKVVLDGSVVGIPTSAAIDAVAFDFDTNEFLLSFDTTVDLPGLAGVADEAVVSYDGVGFAVVFDGAPLGALADSLDTDALTLLTTGALRLSFDGSGMLGGVTFDDEDLLDHTVGSGVWTLAYDGSASDPDWQSADLVAVPEPGFVWALAAGAAWLAALGRIRIGRRSD